MVFHTDPELCTLQCAHGAPACVGFPIPLRVQRSSARTALCMHKAAFSVEVNVDAHTHTHRGIGIPLEILGEQGNARKSLHHPGCAP